MKCGFRAFPSLASLRPLSPAHFSAPDTHTHTHTHTHTRARVRTLCSSPDRMMQAMPREEMEFDSFGFLRVEANDQSEDADFRCHDYS